MGPRASCWGPFCDGGLGVYDRPGRSVGSPSRPCCGGGHRSAAPCRRARHRGPLSGPTPLAGLGGSKPYAAMHGPRTSHPGLVVPRPARDKPPFARGARVPLPILHATWSRRRMESRRGLFGITPFRAMRAELCPGPHSGGERRPGRASRERPSVAGVPTLRGVPTFAATARPRRG